MATNTPKTERTIALESINGTLVIDLCGAPGQPIQWEASTTGNASDCQPIRANDLLTFAQQLTKAVRDLQSAGIVDPAPSTKGT